ncbi:MAG: hypothetical protein A3J14_01230 [Candidatus Levybacteria bacterium RIFCSPLOWO2_02_FULL_37_18]|nr:MAG: hypothetical protein A3J14_01230 [Candidatus Levybacteria bacterium RIFCSPLOWO2_02_FULL_37_18]
MTTVETHPGRREVEPFPFSLPIVTRLGDTPISNADIEAYAKKKGVTTASGTLLTAEKIFANTGVSTRFESGPLQTQESMARSIAAELAEAYGGPPNAIVVSSNPPPEKKFGVRRMERVASKRNTG